MGDGTVNRFAIIINGNGEQRYLDQAGAALADAEEEGYETVVVGPSPLSNDTDHYIPHISDLVAGMSGRIDDDDELLIYISGYGAPGCLDFPEGCIPAELPKLLDAIVYGQRTIFINQSYGNSLMKMFSDVNTLFVYPTGVETNSIGAC